MKIPPGLWPVRDDRRKSAKTFSKTPAMMRPMTQHITFTVDLAARSYPIHIGGGLLSRVKELVPMDLTGRKIFVLYDKDVEAHAQRLADALDAPFMLGMPGGEQAKSLAGLHDVLDWLLDNRVNRNSVLFVVGGGVMGDLGGFAAASVLRGIPFVQVPTTLLAQVDSSVGGKTGINAPQGKNLIGAFYQPAAVLCDTDTLKTLPMRERLAGYAEIVKYGLLGSRDFYDWLEANGEKVLALEDNALSYAIETSCRMKAEIVGTDEREEAGGRRALLNLGHTFGHALEAAAGYDGRLLHGEGVSIGMVLAFRLCVKMGLCPGQDAVRMEKHLRFLGLKTEIRDIPLKADADKITDLMYGDKKADGKRIGFILTRGIGNAFQSKDVDMAQVRAIVAESL